MLNLKNKKIVIATFLYTNYGGLLQGYALQKYLKKFDNFNVVNLNFRTTWHDKDARVFNLYGGIKSKIGQILFTLIRLGDLINRKRRTELFKKKHFNLTEVYSNSEEFINNPPEADIYISGSDQVFNPNGNYKDVFYLNFKKNQSKKVAYAASFGINVFTDEYTAELAPLIKDFDSLSSREKEGSNYMSSIVGKEVAWVTDPSFLLNRDEWKEIAILPKINYKYIFVYALASERELIKIARSIKEKTGLKIICLRSNTRNFIFGDKVIYGCGPSEFIGYIMNAEYVVTDSFHGTVFSSIFDKPFYTFISRPELSIRIYNLIELLNAHNNVITQEDLLNFRFEILTQTLNKDNLNKLIDKSKTFIQNEIINEDI